MRLRRVRASATRVRVGRRRCAVAAGTPLAALVRSRVARVRLRDYGRCSRRVRDGGGLFVRAIGRVHNRREAGWVYKVGTRVGTAGAADPSGPFGRGRLRRRAHLVWFYCREAGNCQRTLGTSSAVEAGGVVAVRVLAYDDFGSAVPGDGATVRVGVATAVAGADGSARVAVPPGSYTVVAEQAGRVRSYPERVVVP